MYSLESGYHCYSAIDLKVQLFAVAVILKLHTKFQIVQSNCLVINATSSAEILEQPMVARNRVGIRLSYRPARLYRLAESIS